MVVVTVRSPVSSPAACYLGRGRRRPRPSTPGRSLSPPAPRFVCRPAPGRVYLWPTCLTVGREGRGATLPSDQYDTPPRPRRRRRPPLRHHLWAYRRRRRRRSRRRRRRLSTREDLRWGLTGGEPSPCPVSAARTHSDVGVVEPTGVQTAEDRGAPSTAASTSEQAPERARTRRRRLTVRCPMRVNMVASGVGGSGSGGWWWWLR